jgi:transposase
MCQLVRIVTLAQSGMSSRQTAAHLGISKTGVQAILHNWAQFGMVDRRSGSGRPRIASDDQDEAIIQRVPELAPYPCMTDTESLKKLIFVKKNVQASRV